MKIFCSPELLDFFQNGEKGALLQERLNSWLEARELNPGQPFMPGQVEHFRFRETQLQIGLNINWVGFRINDAARLIGAVVVIPELGRCFFALELTESHDYQKTLVENAVSRQGHLNAISTFLNSGFAISASTVLAAAPPPGPFQRMVQHGKACLFPDVTQRGLMDLPIRDGVLCFAPPGAGKTMLGVQRVKDYVENDLTVAMCSPTRLLAQTLREEFADQGIADSVRVLTFDDVLESLGVARGENLVDLDCFVNWCGKRLNDLGKQDRKSFKSAMALAETLLWQEFEYVLMQTPDWRNPSTAYLSLDEYCGLGAEQSRIMQAQRATIYQSVFAPFLAYIEAEPTFYYPPLVAHALFLKDLSVDLKFDALVLDEVQKVHPWVSTCFLKLLNQPLAAGQFFICGDAHQGAECQQLRVAETLRNYLEGQRARFSVNHLLVNYRSSQAVTRVVLQIHAIEMDCLGSIERLTHLHPKINCDAQEGNVVVIRYDDEIKQLIASDPKAYVLIPDESCWAEAVQKWPAGQVVSLSEFSGLSGETIVMYGFGEYYQEVLRRIDIHFKSELPAWNKEYFYTRKDNDIAQRTCLQSIYTAASRAMNSLYIIDSQPGFLGRVVANSCLAVPVAAAPYPIAVKQSTPQEWLERAHTDFIKGLVDQAKATLLDEVKMGAALVEAIAPFLSDGLTQTSFQNINRILFPRQEMALEVALVAASRQAEAQVSAKEVLPDLTKAHLKFIGCRSFRTTKKQYFSLMINELSF